MMPGASNPAAQMNADSVVVARNARRSIAKIPAISVTLARKGPKKRPTKTLAMPQRWKNRSPRGSADHGADPHQPDGGGEQQRQHRDRFSHRQQENDRYRECLVRLDEDERGVEYRFEGVHARVAGWRGGH
jgi:hypothetical protein